MCRRHSYTKQDASLAHGTSLVPLAKSPSPMPVSSACCILINSASNGFTTSPNGLSSSRARKHIPCWMLFDNTSLTRAAGANGESSICARGPPTLGLPSSRVIRRKDAMVRRVTMASISSKASLESFSISSSRIAAVGLIVGSNTSSLEGSGKISGALGDSGKTQYVRTAPGRGSPACSAFSLGRMAPMTEFSKTLEMASTFIVKMSERK
mmetsp:Transcript_33627/g.75494  ORF Transcript_33627/g.75494 Transcript_33627/m.75494 type:complete len:210 (-) Transcript_33627:568-1197(-)